MPYKTIAELPQGVKVLPSHAQSIWRNVFNQQESAGKSEEIAVKSAWSQVKNSYKKNPEGKWVRLSESNVYVVDLADTENVNLADKKYKKQILRFGKWLYDSANSGGSGVFEVTKERAKELVRNFKEKALENVPVTRGHATISEVDRNPDLVAGYVEDLELGEDGVYAVFRTADDRADEEIETKYKNVSSSVDENYEDHETGESRGFTLRHLALTTEPYIKKLKPQFVALSDEYDKNIININLTDMAKKKDVNLEEGTKVEETKAEETKTDEAAKTTEETTETTEATDEAKKDESTEATQGAEETAEAKEEEGTEKKEEDVEGSEKDVEEKTGTKEEEAKEEAKEEVEEETKEEVELSEVEKQLRESQDKIAKLEAEKAESKVEVLLSEGKILPVQKEETLALLQNKEMVNLAEGESKSVSELFDAFLSKNAKQVDLSEKGVQVTKTKETSEGKSYLGLPKKEFDRAINLYPTE